MPTPAEDLNTALRELIETVRTADLDGIGLDDVIRGAQALTARLRPHRVDSMRMQAALRYEDHLGGRRVGPDEVDDEARDGVLDPPAIFPYSPVVGPLNPLSPPVSMWRAGGEVHGEAVFGAAYNGPPDSVHGGVIAEVLDELLGSVCVTNGLGGFTGTLTVVYRSTTPLDTPIRLRGWHDRSEGRKIFARGTMHAGDRLCVEAEGIFIRSEQLSGDGTGPG